MYNIVLIFVKQNVEASSAMPKRKGIIIKVATAAFCEEAEFCKNSGATMLGL
jgi:hypothetical protein